MWSVVAERSSALDSSSGIVRMWVRIPAWPVAALVSLNKTLNHNCFVLRLGRKAVGPVCCVMHVKEPRTLIVKEKWLAPVFLDSRLEHPAGWICARYKSSVLLLLLWRFSWGASRSLSMDLIGRWSVQQSSAPRIALVIRTSARSPERVMTQSKMFSTYFSVGRVLLMFS